MENPLKEKFTENLNTFFKEVLLDEEDSFEYNSYGIKFRGRRTSHFIFNLGIYVPTVDIVNVQVDKEIRGTGFFKTLILKYEEVAKQQNRVLFVECVTNPTLKDILLKHGYNIELNSAGVVYRTVNMYKIL